MNSCIPGDTRTSATICVDMHRNLLWQRFGNARCVNAPSEPQLAKVAERASFQLTRP